MANAHLVDGVAGRLVVRGEHHRVGLRDLGGEAGIVHDVRVDRCDAGGRVAVAQHVGDGVGLLLADVASAADMPDDVLRSEDVVVD